uniref:Calmodulin n=1 Tax=Macrostomum lignano TaxID=282301 RepID=A0A1I8IIP7_9PLAT
MSRRRKEKSSGSTLEEDLLRELSREQMIEYFEAFQRYDHDGSGTIDIAELSDIMTSMGLHVREDDLDVLIRQVDEDRSGNLDFLEFLNLMVRHINKPVTKDEIRSAFFSTILTTRGDRMTLEEANEMIAAADINGDGMINYEEFSAALVDNE